MKYVTIVLAAPGGSGKTTTSQTFATGEPQEFCEVRNVQLRNRREDRKVHWTLMDNCAFVGNYASGTDANVGPSVVKEAFEEAISKRRVVIVDGYMSTPRWVDMINEWDREHYPKHEMVVLFVYFHLPMEEVMRRIAQRRDTTVEDLFGTEEHRTKKQASKLDTCKGNMKRPITIDRHFQTKSIPEVVRLNVYEDDSPDTIVSLLNNELNDILGKGWEEEAVVDAGN